MVLQHLERNKPKIHHSLKLFWLLISRVRKQQNQENGLNESCSNPCLPGPRLEAEVIRGHRRTKNLEPRGEEINDSEESSHAVSYHQMLLLFALLSAHEFSHRTMFSPPPPRVVLGLESSVV